MLFVSSIVYAGEIGKPTVYLNGEKIEIEALTIFSTTFVPFRPIFEEFDMEVEWDNKSKTVTAKNETTTIKLTDGSLDGYVNGQKVQLESSPSIEPKSGVFYVNLRFIAESIGAKVKWKKVSDSEMYVYIDLPKEKAPTEATENK
nr:copper amine oxidase N-terminal domain-containing protein [Paenibacillus alvei]